MKILYIDLCYIFFNYFIQNSEIRNPLVYLSCNDLDLYQGPTLFETMRDEDKMFYVYDHDVINYCIFFFFYFYIFRD